MAYRIAMMTFACTAFLSLWALTRRRGGEAAARLVKSARRRTLLFRLKVGVLLKERG
jgi:hypothetical protein